MREGSYATRDKYASVCRDFAKHCHEKYRLNNLRNISDKHLASYALSLQERGLESKTIKTNLGAIRFMHSRIDRPRYLQLADNRSLENKYNVPLEKVKAVNGDRAWTKSEYDRMQNIARQNITGPHGETARNVSDCMTLARSMGMRVAEAACARRSQVEHALRTGMYQVGKEAKNGRPREIPLSAEARRMFERRLVTVSRGDRIFIKPNERAHQVINRMEKFLERHRDKVVTQEGIDKRMDLRDGSTRELTFHGLRYSYVQERMLHEITEGRTWEEAAAIVSQEVGHNRTEVIKIYEAGIFSE